MSAVLDPGIRLRSKTHRLRIHEAICRCPKCKGETNPEKLCTACALLDDLLDGQLPGDTVAPSVGAP